jgi:hypothetical protein
LGFYYDLIVILPQRSVNKKASIAMRANAGPVMEPTLPVHSGLGEVPSVNWHCVDRATLQLTKKLTQIDLHIGWEILAVTRVGSHLGKSRAHNRRFWARIQEISSEYRGIVSELFLARSSAFDPSCRGAEGDPT